MQCAAKKQAHGFGNRRSDAAGKYLQRDSTADYSTRARFCQRLIFCLFFGVFFAVAQLFFASVRAADGRVLQNVGEICAKSRNILSMKRCPLRGFFLGQSAVALFLRKGIDSINFMLFHKFFFRNFPPGSGLWGADTKVRVFFRRLLQDTPFYHNKAFLSIILCVFDGWALFAIFSGLRYSA